MFIACVALQNTQLIPMVLLPLVVGALIQPLSYPLLLAAGVDLMGINVLVGLRLLDPRHTETGACLV